MSKGTQMPDRRQNENQSELETEATWQTLSDSTLSWISECGRKRLEFEVETLAPKIRENITEPAHSVKSRFTYWERLVKRMEEGWPADDEYPITAHSNDLDSRDELEETIREAPEGVRTELPFRSSRPP
ncbi:hypothetical protein ACWEV4_25120 [Streptomyces sp. NPDC003860]